jgi:dolichyl-phosphate-mannose-protein mannosyltransferase
MVSLDVTERRSRVYQAFLLTGLIVLAAFLRFWRLGNWSFDSDETFTLRDSVNLDPRNPRPLLYILNHYLSPIIPLDEWGLRFLPALFGVLGVVAFYFVVSRLVGRRAALFGALLLTFSGLHLYYSQFARYWSLVFLLCTIYPYAIYLGLRDHNRRMLALGVLTGITAVLAHPASVLLVGGLALWAIVTYVGPDRLARLKSRRTIIRLGVVLAVLAVIIAARFVPLLRGWISAHDTGRTPSEFLLHLPAKPGVKQIAFLFGFLESLTFPLVLTGALGLLWLWRRDRSLAMLLTWMLLLPIAFIVLLSFRTPVGVFYLVPTIPVLFIGAGIFLDRLTTVESGLRPRWLLAATLALIIIAAGAPTLVSQYRDGRRYDFRAAARWLDRHMAGGDVVFSDQFKVVAHYLPTADIQRLTVDTNRLAQSVQVHQTGRPRSVWIVAPAPSHAFRTNPYIGGLRQWIYNHCQLLETVGEGRVDFRQYYLQIYRCPADIPRATASSE